MRNCRVRLVALGHDSRSNSSQHAHWLPRWHSLVAIACFGLLDVPVVVSFPSDRPDPRAPKFGRRSGTLLHAVLEDLFDLPAAERTIEAAKELLLPTWERMLVDNPDAAFAL